MKRGCVRLSKNGIQCKGLKRILGDDEMKCIYCNSEDELTSSDIITYAITGAKLTKSFVCKTHNAFTNDNYEKKFVADLDFFRNQLGLTTRDGKTIQYRADISVDGTEIHNVKLSNRESLYAPKDVVAGTDNDGNKILMAPMEKLKKISKGKATSVNMSDVVVHKTVGSNDFIGFHAIHSMAKMAYEWYCYINSIEEYKEEYQEIVDYILGKTEQEVVDIIIDNYYYWAIDQLSEIGTNSFFQYDDLDGYRYVVIDFWKTIAYRIRICKSPNDCLKKVRALPVTLYLYHIDGSKTQQVFGVVLLEKNKQAYFKTICPQNMTADIWGIFTSRIGKIMSTMVLSIHILKREVKNLSDKLDKYNAGKIDVTALLGFEENNIVTTIDILSQIYLNKDKYDMTKTFNQNLPIVLSLHSDTIGRTQEDKKKFIQLLVDKDKDNELSEYIWNGINFFDEIYKNEMNLPK